MNGYRLHLAADDNKELDSSAFAASSNSQTSGASPATALETNHDESSVPADDVHDAFSVPSSSANSAAPVTQSTSSEKFLCKPWLDSIFMAIYGDLVAYVVCFATVFCTPIFSFFLNLFLSRYYEWLGQEDRLKPDGAEAEEGFRAKYVMSSCRLNV
jgi:Ca2+-dependent lipid-binding protein